MWELDHKESWAPKNSYFWTLVLEKTLESLLDSKEINSEYSLEGLKLKLQYFGHLMERTDSLEKTLILGKIEGRRRRGRHRVKWLTWGWASSGSWWWTGNPGALQSMESQRVGHDWATEQQATHSMVFCYSSLNSLWHPKESKTAHISTNEYICTCISMFIAALYTIAERWTPQISINGWTKNFCYIIQWNTIPP